MINDSCNACLRPRFDIVSTLGSGTLATVYRCVDITQTNREVAVKLFVPDVSSNNVFVGHIKEAVLQYCDILHPNINRIYEFLTYPDRVGYVMELAHKGSLADMMQSNERPAARRLLNIFVDVCNGLQELHNRGMRHGAISGNAVLITQNEVGQLADGCVSGCRLGFREWSEDNVIPSIANASPERLLGDVVDTRSDIYSFGVLAYYALTGRSPFGGKSVHAIARSILMSQPPPPSVYNPACSATLDAIVLRAMNNDPAKRYQTAGDVARAIEHHRAKHAP